MRKILSDLTALVFSSVLKKRDFQMNTNRLSKWTVGKNQSFFTSKNIEVSASEGSIPSCARAAPFSHAITHSSAAASGACNTIKFMKFLPFFHMTGSIFMKPEWREC